MRKIVLLLALAGCTAAPELTGNANGGVVTFGTRRADEMAHGRGPNVAFRLAEDHCSRFGRSATIQQSSDMHGSVAFACVPR